MCRPRLEVLEDRTVPATTFTVKNLNNLGLDSLRQAIIDANALSGDDVIIFTGGLTGTIQLASALPDLTSNIDIQGSGASVLTVARGSAAGTPDFRIFTVAQNTAVTLSGLTLTNGKASGNELGGGIHNAGRLTLTNSTLSNNIAADGSGGGIVNFGTLMVTNCTLSGNKAGGGGGGISNSGTLSLTNSTLSGNQAQYGGGLYNNGSLFTVGVATLTNATLTANRADIGNTGTGTGGGIYFGDFGTLTLHNTLVAGNFKGSGTARDDVVGAVAAASSFNLIGDGTSLSGLSDGSNGNEVGVSGSDPNPIDPRLGPLQDNGGPTFTHALLPGSRAIDRGLGLGAPPADQRGVGRRGPADIGAFEFTPPPPAQARAIVAALVSKKVKKTRRLFVRVTFADTGALKTEVRSPFQRPAFRRIAVAILDSNGDGAPDAVEVTAVRAGPRKKRVRKLLSV